MPKECARGNKRKITYFTDFTLQTGTWLDAVQARTLLRLRLRDDGK